MGCGRFLERRTKQHDWQPITRTKCEKVKKLNFFQNRPKAEKIDVGDYLTRIKLSRKTPSLLYLKELQKAHLLHIPFENLDIHYRNKITLNYSSIFEKLIQNKRGGFCYELNGLFYHLLYHLGFNCYLISAKVYNVDTDEWGNNFDHMAIIVEIDNEKYLVDVGFGNGPISPLKVDSKEMQMDYTRYWKMTIDPDENLILQESADSAYFKSRYLFTSEERQFIEFMEMCEYHQTSPKSKFTQQKIITKFTSTGRVSLTDKKINLLELGIEQEWPIMNEDEFLSKLEQHFGISFKQLTNFSS